MLTGRKRITTDLENRLKELINREYEQYTHN
jgi:hypothetical protein